MELQCRPAANGHAAALNVLLVEDSPGDVRLTREASIAAEDVATSYKLQANCHLSKPVDLEDFESSVKSINDFWLGKPELPKVA
jgi:hypothetical protein